MKYSLYPPQRKIERETEKFVKREFERKRKLVGVDAELDLNFVDDVSTVGDNVFGEAFPDEEPPRVWLEVFAPDATEKELTKTICEELIHVKRPDMEKHGSVFYQSVKKCVKEV